MRPPANTPPRELNSSHYLMLYLDAAGKKPSEIARILEVSTLSVRAAQQSDDYKKELLAVREEIKNRIISTAVGRADMLEEAFNEEAYASFSRLVQLRDTGGKDDGVKLRAAESLLNRSTDAPRVAKTGESEGEGKIVVQIPMQTLGNMNQALRIAGRGDVVELIESGGGKFEVGKEVREVSMVTPEEFDGFD